MKKIYKLLSIVSFTFILLSITSCANIEKKVSIIAPTGTPSLGIAEAISDDTLFDYNIVSGSDPLIAAFTNATYDIVVAPVNLGGKFYNTTENFEYVLYQTIVWGNYYLASTYEINNFSELDGKTLLVFGKNSTPDVVVRSLIAANNLNVTLEYVDDVSTANSYLISGKADVIVSAEPSITKFSQNKSFYTYDLQKEWQELTGNYSFPQAGIFVKKTTMNTKKVQDALLALTNSVKLASIDPNKLVSSAVKIDESLNKIGEEVLQQAILKCNLRFDSYQKEAINFYFQKVIDLGIGKTVGEKLPDEGFYYFQE